METKNKDIRSRCERNNNPLNIIKTKSKWLGLKPEWECTDSRFCEFTDPVYGFRAALLLIKSYITKYHCNTIWDIVHRWCPDGTADMYAHYVAKHSGVKVRQELKWSEESYSELSCIVYSMARMEGYSLKSSDITYEEITKAWQMIWKK